MHSTSTEQGSPMLLPARRMMLRYRILQHSVMLSISGEQNAERFSEKPLLFLNGIIFRTFSQLSNSMELCLQKAGLPEFSLRHCLRKTCMTKSARLPLRQQTESVRRFPTRDINWPFPLPPTRFSLSSTRHSLLPYPKRWNWASGKTSTKTTPSCGLPPAGLPDRKMWTD